MADQLTLSLIFIGALGDSINPCAIAVLGFLVAFLFTIQEKKKRFLLIGLTYILFVYLTYFGAGLGLLSLVQSLRITSVIFVLSSILVTIAGIINITEAILKDKGFSLSIPQKAKPIIQKYVKKSTIPATMLLGVLVSLFELPCTGGIYISIIALLAEQATKAEGILYLLFYNLIFVLPLVLILFIAYFSLSSETINSWIKKNKRWLRLIIGIVMMIMGVGMLYYYVPDLI